MEPVGLVVLGRCPAVPLAGDRVHEHRAAEGLRAPQGVLQRRDVVAVDGADVLEAEVLEQPLRGHGVLEALLDAVQRLVGEPAGRAAALQRRASPLQEALVPLGGPQGREVVRQAADRRRVGALVVVDHDDDRTVGGGDVVQRLPGHAAGQRAVAHDGDDAPVVLAPQRVALRDAVGPGQGGGGVRVLDDVVLALGPARVARQAAGAAEAGEVLPPGEQLVHVGLVTGVEDERVVRGVEHAVQRERELDHAEVGPEMPAGARDVRDQERPDLRRQVRQLVGRHLLQVVRPARSTPAPPCPGPPRAGGRARRARV